jgi:hypothetical protein
MQFGAGGQPLPAQAYQAVALWNTPTSLAPAKGGNNEAGNSAGLVAIRRVAIESALWNTPVQDDTGIRKTRYAQGGMALSMMAAEAVLWPTPAARDFRAPNNPDGASRGDRPPTSGKQLPNEVVEALGPTALGYREQMGSFGGLNPAFVSWLMGYPAEWVSCAPSATPSSRRSGQKSSRPTSTLEQALWTLGVAFSDAARARAA